MFFCACWKISLDNIIYFCLYVFINKIFSFRHIASKNLDEMAIFQCIIKFFSALYYIQEITCLIAPVLHYRLNRAYAWSCTVFTHNHAVSPLQKNAVMTGIPVPDFEPRYDISPPFTTHLLINAGPLTQCGRHGDCLGQMRANWNRRLLLTYLDWQHPLTRSDCATPCC